MSNTGPYIRLPHSDPHHSSGLAWTGPHSSDDSSSTSLGQSMARRRSSVAPGLATFWSKATSTRRLPLLVLGALCLFIVLELLRPKTHGHGEGTDVWKNFGVPRDERGLPVMDFEAGQVGKEWECNPFKQPGRLRVDLNVVTNNVWRPFDGKCSPSTLMELIYAGNGSSVVAAPRGKPVAGLDGKPAKELPFPWLVNATILLQGDSMERLHLTDFCNLVGGVLINIDPQHPASPPLYRKPHTPIVDVNGVETIASIEAKRLRIADEDRWDDRPGSWFFTRPWVCDIKEYEATVINVFTWGMQDMEPVFQSEEFFHGPSTWMQRFQHITIPLLTSLSTHLSRPQILHPTLIELASGFWDLRGFTEQDFITSGISKPYPMTSEIPFGVIGEEREGKWKAEMEEVVKMVARYFPGEDGVVRSGPVISWRTLHHPRRNNYTPYSRAYSLDQLARYSLHNLRLSSLLTKPTSYATARKKLLATKDLFFSRPASPPSQVEDLGLDERLRVSEYGALLLGQENHFKDFLHPDVLPGSYLWSDMLLYELKRAVERVGRSD